MTIRVQTRDNHFVVLAANGDEILTSKEYASDASAKRSATNFYEKVSSGDVVLEEAAWEGTAKNGRWTKGTVLSEGPSKQEPTSTPSMKKEKIEVPDAGGPLHATNPLATGVVDEKASSTK
jgi:hypothetical protein